MLMKRSPSQPSGLSASVVSLTNALSPAVISYAAVHAVILKSQVQRTSFRPQGSRRFLSSSTIRTFSGEKYWWNQQASPSTLSGVSESSISNVQMAPSKRIHILGTGSIGCLIAHSLVGLPEDVRPPVTLLLHRKGLLDDLKEKDGQVVVRKRVDGEGLGRKGFDVEVLDKETGTWTNDQGSTNEKIDTLVVTVKGAATVDALRSVESRLNGPESTVLFLQNGMGQLDELNEALFRDPATRPRYMQGIISHGVFLVGPFDAVHAGDGDLHVGMVTSGVDAAQPNLPLEEAENALWSPNARHLATSLLSCKELHTTVKTSTQVLATQLMKLSVNATNNTITSILDILNGHQLTNPVISSKIMPSLASEISNIILSFPEFSPERMSSEVRKAFEPEPLEKFMKDMIYVNRRNSSSMREDMIRKRETEVKYINGYLVKRGKEIGVDVKLNEMILNLVEAKTLEVMGKIKNLD